MISYTYKKCFYFIFVMLNLSCYYLSSKLWILLLLNILGVLLIIILCVKFNFSLRDRVACLDEIFKSFGLYFFSDDPYYYIINNSTKFGFGVYNILACLYETSQFFSIIWLFTIFLIYYNMINILQVLQLSWILAYVI